MTPDASRTAPERHRRSRPTAQPDQFRRSGSATPCPKGGPLRPRYGVPFPGRLTPRAPQIRARLVPAAAAPCGSSRPLRLGASRGHRRLGDQQPGRPSMTRHDLLVQTAAPHRGSTGWFAPGGRATTVMRANLINTVAADTQVTTGNINLTSAPRNMPRRAAGLLSGQNSNPRSPVHADRGCSCMGGFATPNDIPNPSPSRSFRPRL